VRTILGVDPGLKGGIAFIRPDITPWVVAMPVSKIIVNKRTKHEIDEDELADLFWSVRYSDMVVLYMEQVCARPGQGVTSMFTFGEGYGVIQGVAAAYNIPVKLVAPQTWKKQVLGTRWTHDKLGAIQFCNEVYPEVSLIPAGRRVPQDGLADSLCVAHYGWRMENV
jgi:crossover junction endodeoxyribonuclease RuvC